MKTIDLSKFACLVTALLLTAHAEATPKTFEDYPLCARLRYLYTEKPGTPFEVMTPYYQNTAINEAAAMNVAAFDYERDGCGKPLSILELFDRQDHCGWSGPYLRESISFGEIPASVLENYRQMTNDDFQAFRSCYHK